MSRYLIYTWQFVALMIVGSLVFAQCNVNDSTPNTRPYYQYTTGDSTEATNMALWFTGELSPPANNFNTHLFNLKHIRTIFHDSLQLDSSMVVVLGATFNPPWVVGEILVKFTDSVAEHVRNGTYTGWDSLPPGMEPDTIPHMPDILGWALFRYHEPTNPRRLADIYRKLPGVLNADPNLYLYADGYMNVYPTFVGGNYGYYFTISGVGQGSGAYFKFISGVPTFIGEWDFPSEPMPSWYDEVTYVSEHFAEWDGFNTTTP